MVPQAGPFCLYRGRIAKPFWRGAPIPQSGRLRAIGRRLDWGVRSRPLLPSICRDFHQADRSEQRWDRVRRLLCKNVQQATNRSQSVRDLRASCSGQAS